MSQKKGGIRKLGLLHKKCNFFSYLSNFKNFWEPSFLIPPFFWATLYIFVHPQSLICSYYIYFSNLSSMQAGLCYQEDLECGQQLSLLSPVRTKQINISINWVLPLLEVSALPLDIFTLLCPWRVITLNTKPPFNLVTFLPSLLCDAATTDCPSSPVAKTLKYLFEKKM